MIIGFIISIIVFAAGLIGLKVELKFSNEIAVCIWLIYISFITILITIIMAAIEDIKKK